MRLWYRKGTDLGKRVAFSDTMAVSKEQEEEARKLGFLPNKEAQEYFKGGASEEKKPVETVTDGQEPTSLERARELYEKTFDKKVPNNKKNDVNWILSAIEKK